MRPDRACTPLIFAASLLASSLAHGAAAQPPAEVVPAAAPTSAAPAPVVATATPAPTPSATSVVTPTAASAATSATPATTAAAPSARTVPPAGPSAVSEISPPLPRLTLSAGFLFGPHAQGEADCQTTDAGDECQHNGNFLGAGATIELRAQLYKILYLHVRGLVVGNLRKRPRAVHSGLAGGGIGLGVYSRLAFARVEYLLIPALGGDNYVPPFYDKPVARDVYGVHAGLISAGIHKYVSPRVALEGWAGLVIGPHSRRTSISEQVAESRVLVSFMVNLGLSFDVLLAKGYKPPPRRPRQRRQW